MAAGKEKMFNSKLKERVESLEKSVERQNESIIGLQNKLDKYEKIWVDTILKIAKDLDVETPEIIDIRKKRTIEKFIDDFIRQVYP